MPGSLLASKLLYFIVFLNIIFQTASESKYCSKVDNNGEDKCKIQSHFSRNRYILYDINPPEGFNLRRDVYVRIAVFIRNLIEQEEEYNWQLVLPPWGNLYHWRSKNVGSQMQLAWGLFFDIRSLQKYIPVIEMYNFLREYPSEDGTTELDVVYFLQNDEEMFKTGKFKDKNEITECPRNLLRYRKLNNEEYAGYFWGYNNVTARDVKCVSFHGMMSDLISNLKPSLYRSVMFDHMEIPLHDYYGSREYWRARRSMRYNRKLYDIANEFREKFLNSTNEIDNTLRPEDWTTEKDRRAAIGGPYLSVHLRRRDFLVGRSSTVPSVKFAAKQLKNKMNELKLNVVFVATDATKEEFEELKTYLPNYTVRKFVPPNYVLNEFKDGGVAIIDQIICSYARYFIGTHESTFTFRIQEDREIIGFPAETTFNRLCKGEENCDPTGRWEIIW